MSDEVREARKREESFVSHVEGLPKSASRKKKFSFKKHMPVLVIVGLLFLGVGLIFISQSLMPFAIVNRFREEFNTLGISSTLRSDNILDYQLENPASALRLSETQRTSLSASEIYPVDASLDGIPFTALVFAGSRGVYSAVVPNSVLEKADSSAINSAINSSITDSRILVSGTPLSTSSAKSVAAFEDKYSSASKLWRGGSSGWYDSFTNLTEARLAISRSRYANWATLALNSGTKEAWKKLASGTTKISDDGISSYGTIVETNDAGEEVAVTTSGAIDSDSLTSQTTVDGIEQALNSKITSLTKVLATAGCAGVEIGTAIYTVMSAQQSLQYLNLTTGYFEATQSVQAGLNDGTPMNEYTERLTKKDPETGKSAMESAGMAALFSGTKISSSDESVKHTNFENLISSLGSLSGNVVFTTQAFQACSYVRMGVAATNFATTMMAFVPVLGQATTAIHIVAKVVGKIAIGVAVGTIVSFIVPKIVESVAENIIKNTATEWLGEDLGNALSSGANKYLGGNFQTGGGMAASTESLAAYFRAKEAVLAEEAEIERRTLSPFDVTSKNTFFGKLAYDLIPLATTTSLGSTLKSFGNLVTKSTTSILPSASAISETELMDSIGECPILESIGLVGDAYCNPYYITDTSTISASPAEIEEKVASLDPSNFSGVDKNGQKIINPNSNLGKKITICDQRVASLGMADATAANILVSRPSTLVANLPLIGDVAEIVSASQQAANMPWISGQACADSPENPYREEMQIYQRYIEDQRLYESAGIVEESSVTAFLKNYYGKTPLDNSYEGILARYSGMEKSEVIAALDYIDALTFLANYDPSERKILSADETSENTPISLSNFISTYAKIKDDGQQFGLFEKRRDFFVRRNAEFAV